ncbi:hypothetical protein B0H13DRAFT_1915727 [Mycena leptocephala]|nr:hypothetical protein B0H13DRAFT_1915727 [Mycena leptocephala]
MARTIYNRLNLTAMAPPLVSVSASGLSTPPAALPACLSLGVPDPASRRSPGDTAKLFSPMAPSHCLNMPQPCSLGFFQTHASPTVAISTPDLTSSFGKPGPILGRNTSETSEESVLITFPLGEADAEGEGVVVDGAPGAEGEMHVD